MVVPPVREVSSGSNGVISSFKQGRSAIVDDFVSIQIDQVFDLFVGVDFLKAVAVEDVVSVS